MSLPKAPKIKPQGAAPAPVNIETAQRELGDEERSMEQRKKRGRGGLRIDPQSGGVNGKGGAGINIPQK